MAASATTVTAPAIRMTVMAAREYVLVRASKVRQLSRTWSQKPPSAPPLASTMARRTSLGSNDVLTMMRLTLPSGVRNSSDGGCAYWPVASDH